LRRLRLALAALFCIAATLARAAGVRVIAFGAGGAFRHFVGMPPMQYLAGWRMQIASGLLSNGGGNIATIAPETGYGSEAAFRRAFKKLVGMPPSAWRNRGSAKPEG
jgi:AraC-like DNA-binding protein